jgi:hypothetical protein
MVEVTPLPANGSIFFDPRDSRRSMRVSWHAEAGVFVISMWRDDSCVASFPLAAGEAARFVHTFVSSLAGDDPAAIPRRTAG